MLKTFKGGLTTLPKEGRDEVTTLFASISTLRVAQPVYSHIVSVGRRRFPASLTGPFPEAREALMSGVRQGDDERQTGRAHALPPRREALPVSVVPAHLHHHLQPANSPTHSHRFVRSLSFVSLVERSSVCLVLLLLGATIDGGWGGGAQLVASVVGAWLRSLARHWKLYFF